MGNLHDETPEFEIDELDAYDTEQLINALAKRYSHGVVLLAVDQGEGLNSGYREWGNPYDLVTMCEIMKTKLIANSFKKRDGWNDN